MENVVNSEYFKLAVVLKSVLGFTHHEMKDIRENISKYKKRKEIVQEINDYLNDDEISIFLLTNFLIYLN